MMTFFRKKKASNKMESANKIVFEQTCISLFFKFQIWKAFLPLLVSSRAIYKLCFVNALSPVVTRATASQSNQTFLIK
ncbi:hypothetical protein [Arcicella rosea]|uniref:hypothetical protein n=1 Tax=Arcicella rosea TaxID=502909 RepID=UPI001C86AA41|nr:hypothetical protein [Arcicella rosea]